MPPSVSDTTVDSTTPSISPFEIHRSGSIGSSTSGLTSDDAPDLGAFITVFRALNTLHPSRVHGTRYNNGDATPTSSLMSPSEYDSELPGGSTVWSHRPIASYLSSGSPESPPSSSSPEPTEADSTLDPSLESTGFGAAERRDGEDDVLDATSQPSLGLFGALDFLAAERAKFVAQRDAVGQRGHSSNTSDGTWQHAISPRRKRRRKRNRSAGVSKHRRRRPEDSPITPGDADETAEGATASYDDADDSSSSSGGDPSSQQQYYRSNPPTPPLELQSHHTANVIQPRIQHSKSTPSLRLPASMPIDARVLQIRNLAHKLRMLFPQDAKALSAILANDHPSPSEMVDPRGPMPRTKDTLIHVFIDHSNILFGFLTYLKRHFRRMDRSKPKQISHAALALILERGRPVTRRVLVTSSPLYQPVDTAEQLGYETSILLRVPDLGDAPDRQQQSSSSGDQSRSQQHTPHKRRPYSHASKSSTSKSSLANGSPPDSDPNSSSHSGRIRYREQGVDELLQLKLHQAIADVDRVPSGATIVLATGDGNVGQFNEEGFSGCVRTALKKGWRVELYAWEGSLSKAWGREFGNNERFVIHSLDRFAMDLLEL
ncbi:hypothetical protein BXZ70DRAFT_925049 [Cristinia sonorae]|uniref:NYN domain-containing protein n=1 Tax=Cristinia sonorae TaxID=1940300 RepID=A0A8K0UU98_9AGAR|nr:hypothetical protein BXZ70DRAFT_925049 [Cristinia sonorae]